MTIIVYRDGILAADTAIWRGCIYVGDAQKITKTNDGILVGAAGNAMECEAFRKWAAGNRRSAWKPQNDDFNGLLIEPSGMVSQYSGLNKVPCNIEYPFHAIGYGYEIAYGALDMGASAYDAVKSAILRHAYCGGNITTLKLNENS